MREKEREGSTKGKGGVYKKLQSPNLPPKWPRSGVTLYFNQPSPLDVRDRVNIIYVNS